MENIMCCETLWCIFTISCPFCVICFILSLDFWAPTIFRLCISKFKCARPFKCIYTTKSKRIDTCRFCGHIFSLCIQSYYSSHDFQKCKWFELIWSLVHILHSRLSLKLDLTFTKGVFINTLVWGRGVGKVGALDLNFVVDFLIPPFYWL